MTNIRQAAVAAAARKIAVEWADQGKILEGGWQAFATIWLKDAPADQLHEMRKAYFLGAEHLFACIMGFLDSDAEPTEQDMRRMSLLHKELDAFRQSLIAG